MEEKRLKYYKMHHDLQEQIRLGELRSGDRIPSENQLAAAYQVSRQTVRKALAILEQEGYIYAVHGKAPLCRSGFARSISLTTLPW